MPHTARDPLEAPATAADTSDFRQHVPRTCNLFRDLSRSALTESAIAHYVHELATATCRADKPNDISVTSARGERGDLTPGVPSVGARSGVRSFAEALERAAFLRHNLLVLLAPRVPRCQVLQTLIYAP